MLAASCSPGSYLGRFGGVVDADVRRRTDVFRRDVGPCFTRCDPAGDIDFIPRTCRARSTRSSTASATNSRAVIDSAAPTALKFPPLALGQSELLRQVEGEFPRCGEVDGE